jgi:hypothetical protein
VPPVTFADVEPPNTISEAAAQWLIDHLRNGPFPSDASIQASLAIERAIQDETLVTLSAEGRRAVRDVLSGAFGISPPPLPPDSAESLRWLEQNIRISLGEDTLH